MASSPWIPGLGKNVLGLVTQNRAPSRARAVVWTQTHLGVSHTSRRTIVTWSCGARLSVPRIKAHPARAGRSRPGGGPLRHGLVLLPRKEPTESAQKSRSGAHTHHRGTQGWDSPLLSTFALIVSPRGSFPREVLRALRVSGHSRPALWALLSPLWGFTALTLRGSSVSDVTDPKASENPRLE